MRIGIDARKLHDFGIGTYIRNLLRELAAIDQSTEYVLLTRPQDMGIAAALGENFRAVADRSGHYSLAEQISIPLAVKREGLDLLHAPHYILPALTPARTVVTIHDCIHLMFPEYLRHRLGYAFARASLYTAAHKSDRIFTVSEQSKRDILKFFDVPPEKIVVTPNAIDDRFSVPPSEEHVVNTRERYQLSHSYLLYVGNIKPHKNLERLIEAFHLVRQQGRSELELHHHRRRNLQAAIAAARRPQVRHSPLRSIFRLRARQDAGRSLSARVGVRLPVAVRGIRPASARSDGQRHAGRDVERLVAAGSRGRRGCARRPVQSRSDRRRHHECPAQHAHARRPARARTRACKAVFMGALGTTRARRLWRGAVVTGDAQQTPAAQKVVLVHDWLTGMRGGEKVLEVLCEAYPTADLLTLFHVRGSVSPVIERMRPRTSALQNLPGIRRFYRYCLPLFPAAIEQFDLDRYDLIISTSHCAAKAVVKTGRARHVCYCFTPMRYAWDQFDAYFGEGRVGTTKSRLLRPVLAALSRWDAATAGRVDHYVAISQHVASRIRRYYNRHADVIYPPVDTGFFSPDDTVATENFLLIVSALAPYKRIDLAIEASRLSGTPLRVIGDGPERAALTALIESTGADVQLLGSVSERRRARLLPARSRRDASRRRGLRHRPRRGAGLRHARDCARPRRRSRDRHRRRHGRPRRRTHRRRRLPTASRGPGSCRSTGPPSELMP